jgi:hypothetical protein
MAQKDTERGPLLSAVEEAWTVSPALFKVHEKPRSAFSRPRTSMANRTLRSSNPFRVFQCLPWFENHSVTGLPVSHEPVPIQCETSLGQPI